MKNLIKVGFGVITSIVLFSGCVGSKPLSISNLTPSTKTIEISKNSVPHRNQGGVLFNDELITDKLGTIYAYGNIGDELYYAIRDTANDRILIKDSKGTIIKEIPDLSTGLIKHGISITQTTDKELFIYETYGNIYKTISKFDGKTFTTLMKNKDIYKYEYKMGKFLFVIPTNSIGPTKSLYQNIETSQEKKISKRLKRIDRKYDMVIFPVVIAGDNIIYTCDDSIFSLNTVTNEIKTLANKDSKVQFLRNGYNYYLRIISNPQDMGLYSKTNDFHIPSQYIDLQSLQYVEPTLSQLNQMKVAKVTDYQVKGLVMTIYKVGDIEKYFRYTSFSNNRKSSPGFLYKFE